MKKQIRIFLVTSALALALPATAETAPASAQTQPESHTLEISDHRLKKFMSAQQEVSAIQQRYAGKLQSESDPRAGSAIQQEMQQKMIESVEKAGLEVPEFNQIATAISQDPALRERAVQLK